MCAHIKKKKFNIISQDFHTDAPNTKWVTDITEFALPAGKVYPSLILDCFDGLVVSWTIGTSPKAELVNRMLDAAIYGLRTGELPIITLTVAVTIDGQIG